MAEDTGRARVDRLSELPDSVLQEILALLPLQELVRTAVLSRRWRHVWPTTPVLNLSSVPEHLRLASYYRVLHRCYNVSGALRSLSVTMDRSFPCSSSLAGIFTTFAELRSVHCLSLAGCAVCHLFGFTMFTAVPQSLYLCRTLRCLFLYDASVDTVPISALFPFLSRVLLSNVILLDKEACALLAACPRIESFTIVARMPLGELIVTSPTLRRLHLIESHPPLDSPCGSIIKIVHAPEIRSISLHCDLINTVEPFKDLKKLQNVTAFSPPLQFLENRQQWLKFVDGIKCARSLSVNHWFLKFITSETAPLDACKLHTEEFHLCSESFTMEKLRSLLLFLKHSTTKHFYLHRGHWAGRSDKSIPEGDDLSEDDCWELIQKKCDLEKIVITGFSGKKVEMLLVKFMMKYAEHLRFMFLYYVKEIKQERLGEISDEVRSFYRVNVDLQVSISELPPDFVCQACDTWRFI